MRTKHCYTATLTLSALALPLVVLTACTSSSTAIQGSTTQPALAQPAKSQIAFSLNQDTPGGHYSQWVGHSAPASGRMSATVSFKELRGTAEWVPFVSLELGSSHTPENHLRFDVAVWEQQLIAILSDGHGHKVPVSGTLTQNVPFQVNLQWHEGETMQVRIDGGPPQSLPFRFRPDQVRILSGSANVYVDNVSIE